MRTLGFSVTVFLAGSTVFAHPGVFHEIESLTVAIVADPSNPDLYLERAIRERLGRFYEPALADLERAKSLGLVDSRIDLEAGLILSAEGCAVEADACLTRYLEQVPGGSADAFLERARIRSAAGREDDAVVDYAAAVGQWPDPDGYLEYGALLERMGRVDDAAGAYRDGFNRLGHAVVLHSALVRVETERGHWAEALALINEVLAAAAVKSDGYLSRARVYESAGRFAAAQADRERALAEAERSASRNPTGLTIYARARAQLALGNTAAARRDLEEARRLAPRFREVQQLLATLATP